MSTWMGIAPGPVTTRVIAMAGASETILKARLSREPSHPRALSTLIEAIALWQGDRVHAAFAADESGGSCESTMVREALEGGGPLYTIAVVPRAGRRRRHRDISGVGDFGDLRQLVMFEVTR